MPFMDGYECTAKIRELYVEHLGLPHKEQPIISAVTGHAEDTYIKKCFRSGMN